MGTRRKKGDSRNFIIAILFFIVAVETFLLVSPPSRKFAQKLSLGRSIAFQPTIKKPEAVSAQPAKLSPPVIAPSSVGQKAVGFASARAKKFAGEPAGPAVQKSVAGRIAIILDDWGYHLESCAALKAIHAPVAVAILPGLDHSVDMAQCAYNTNNVVMLHLPLEPHQYLEKYPENYIITTSMRQQRVERMLEKNLESIPFLQGVNNHMGSKATEDRRLMSIIFSRLKEKRLFFVDSLVTSNSICRNLAKEMNIDFARRDVFLDNKNERRYIENQFAQLAKQARQKGYAIAIGHDRPLTLEIVKEQTEALQKQGFKIVRITELLR